MWSRTRPRLVRYCGSNVYLSDSAPGSRHLLLGKGEADYPALLEILQERYDGNWQEAIQAG